MDSKSASECEFVRGSVRLPASVSEFVHGLRVQAEEQPRLTDSEPESDMSTLVAQHPPLPAVEHLTPEVFPALALSPP